MFWLSPVLNIPKKAIRKRRIKDTINMNSLNVDTSVKRNPLKNGYNYLFLAEYNIISLHINSVLYTMVVHVSLTTVTRVRFRLHAAIWLKLPWPHVRKVLSSLTLPNIAGFLRVLLFSLVVTLDPRRMALTGPVGRTAEVAGRVIQYK